VKSRLALVNLRIRLPRLRATTVNRVFKRSCRRCCIGRSNSDTIRGKAI